MLKAAVIVLAYNSLPETTKPCVESILRAATRLDFKLVIVDNGSTDGTVEYLKVLAGQQPAVRLVINASNLGYPAGNNGGIRSVEADYYILLNSDTVVTDGWLDGLVEFLEAHPDVGLAGPVSNSVTNEQAIQVESADEAGILHEGRAWTAQCRGDFFLTSMLGFFCVAVRREVIEKVGLLDESFGVGTFEDDDYCRRVAQHGYKLACVEDVFVYHKGSVSFQQVPDAEVNEILRRNRRKYEAKHGIAWRTRSAAPVFLDLIEAYLSIHRRQPEKLVFKIGNKIRVLRRCYFPATGAAAESLKRKWANAFRRRSGRSPPPWSVCSAGFPGLVPGGQIRLAGAEY
jgi:GT2 family glycosyltransferase